MDFAHYTNLVRDFVLPIRIGPPPSCSFWRLVSPSPSYRWSLPFWAMLVAIGTIIGASNSLSFWLIVSAAGGRCGLRRLALLLARLPLSEQIQNMWPLTNDQTLSAAKARVLQASWGAWAIIFGRFSGPLRATVPIAAGIAQMPQLASSNLPTGARRFCGRSCCFRPARSA